MAVKYYKEGQWKTFPGTIGPVGKTGKDAYQLAVEGGYTGTKEEFLASLSDLINLRSDLNNVITANNDNHDLILSVQDNIYADIIDNCESTDTDKMLSARQGKVLKDLFDSIKTFKVEIVTTDELPEVGDPRTFYLKKVLKNNKLDTYDEYLYIDNGWELVGTTKINLSNYYTKQEVEDKITEVKTEASNTYYTKEEVTNLLAALEEKIKNGL